MATNHTTNYQLNLWEPTDAFLRTEFNENTQKIDTTLAALVPAAGTYTALGTEDVVVNLGFRPRLVLLISANALAVAIENSIASVYNTPTSTAAFRSVYLQCTDEGFRVRQSEYYFNNPDKGSVIHYIAFR